MLLRVQRARSRDFDQITTPFSFSAVELNVRAAPADAFPFRQRQVLHFAHTDIPEDRYAFSFHEEIVGRLGSAEFAKPRPNLAALSTAADTAHEQIYAARKDFRQHALAFYSSLSPEQQLVVINAIKEKHQRMERFFEKRLQHHSGEG